MDINTTPIARRYEQLHQQHGIMTAIDYLEGMRKGLANLRTEVDAMLREAQNQAVEQRLGMFVYDKPRELAPSKEKFIELFGRDVFDQVKSVSRPKRIFVATSQQGA